jgi:hypothetical protein
MIWLSNQCFTRAAFSGPANSGLPNRPSLEKNEDIVWFGVPNPNFSEPRPGTSTSAAFGRRHFSTRWRFYESFKICDQKVQGYIFLILFMGSNFWWNNWLSSWHWCCNYFKIEHFYPFLWQKNFFKWLHWSRGETDKTDRLHSDDSLSKSLDATTRPSTGRTVDDLRRLKSFKSQTIQLKKEVEQLKQVSRSEMCIENRVTRWGRVLANWDVFLWAILWNLYT